MTEELIEEISQSSEIYSSMMTYLLSRRRTDLVYTFANKTLKINPNCKDAYYFKAIALSNSKMYDDALELIEEGLKKFSNDRKLLGEKSGIYLNLQDYEKCIQIKKKIIESHPKEGEIMLQIAMLLDSTLGRPKEAEEWYEKAVEHKLKTEREYLLLGDALMKIKKYEKAAKSFKKASKKNPEHGYYFYKVACAQALAKNKEKAVKYLKKAIKLEPEEYINKARSADEFKSIRNKKIFKALFGE